jgi:glycine/D-amino acid oxidase-like deaminating enzyme
LASTVVPGKQVVYEVGNITTYFRRDHSDRLLIGGRGIQYPANDLRDYRHLIARAVRLWPALARVRWTHWWNGQLGMSTDGYPGFHRLGPGLFALLGYPRGICFGIMVGGELARILSGEPMESFILPSTEVREIALHRFWKTGVALRVSYGRFLDALGI